MRFSTLSQWLQWQETLHPNAIDLTLERVKEVASRLGIRKPARHVVTVAGTNGKGSTVALLHSIYRAAGYNVASYTSPHLLKYNERIRFNGQATTDAELCDAFQQIDHARDDISLTYFEFGTLASLLLFQQHDPDVCILETGLGGRLDAVNIVDADVAVITTIGLDHQDWLGSTREDIGREKLGIARAGKPLVIGEIECPAATLEQARAMGTRIYTAGRDYGFATSSTQWEWYSGERRISALPIPALRGTHQFQNASTVLQVVDILQTVLPVNRMHLREGLLSATIDGRFQVARLNDVTTVLDVAHNPQAAEVLANNLKEMHRPASVRAVIGMLADKDIEGVINPLSPLIDYWYVCDLNTPRDAGSKRLGNFLNAADCRVKMFNSPLNAYKKAKEDARPHDIILVFGSFYTVADVLSHLTEPVHG